MSPLALVPGGLRRSALAVKTKLFGLGLLVIVLLLIMLSILQYNKFFTPVVKIQLATDSAGNQLQKGGDVKIRGLIVGEIRDIQSTGQGALLMLALQPDKTALIPANVEAQLIPKTLFGEKFVDLKIPQDPAPRPIARGATISQDRTATAVETEQLFDDLMPLLQAVQPAKLNATLGALATALDGRGNALGENLELLDTYLRGLSPSYPNLGEDLRGLADLTDTYSAALPDLLEFLDNTSATSRTLVEKESDLQAFLAGTTRFADTTNTVLTENERRIIMLAADARPVLEVLAKYSPEFPCLTAGLTRQEAFAEKTFGGNPGTDFKGLHITLEITQDGGSYTQADQPLNGDKGGPDCNQLPVPPLNLPAPNLVDGYRDGQGVNNPQPGAFSPPQQSGQPSLPRSVAEALLAPRPVDSGGAGTASEQAVVEPLLAPAMDRPAEDVPDVATLLWGPMARGATVGVAAGEMP